MKKHSAYDDVDGSRNDDVFSGAKCYNIDTTFSHIFLLRFLGVINSFGMRRKMYRGEGENEVILRSVDGLETSKLWKSMCHAYNFYKLLEFI
jgi:hypothetical protein